MSRKIVIPYFPTGMKYATIAIIGGAVFLFFKGYVIWPGILLIVSLIILTTEYVTEINFDERKIEDYVSVIFVPLGMEVKRFNSVEKIIVTKGNYSQVYNTRAQSHQMKWSDFTGSLVFDNDEVLDLLTKTSKRELLNGLKQFADFLRVHVEDHTTNQPYKVDLTRVELED